MSESTQFRRYAEQAMREAATAATEDEKRALSDLACTWAQAALSSEKVFGSSAASPPGGAVKAKPPLRSS